MMAWLRVLWFWLILLTVLILPRASWSEGCGTGGLSHDRRGTRIPQSRPVRRGPDREW